MAAVEGPDTLEYRGGQLNAAPVLEDFEAKYHKIKTKLALLSSSASAPSSSLGKNKGLIAEMYDWDDEEVSSDENEVTKVKSLMALTDEEKLLVGKESVTNATDYDSADESSVCSTPLPPLKKLDGVEPISGPKTFKSMLKSKSTIKFETLKAPAGNLKIVKIEDDPLLAIVMKALNELKLKTSKKKIILL
uniref:Uncharacterized protein n=1 Tax=Tanacetum cinerariifolium TaxID=118510 RepID=A0A699HPQ9_TANCI|nr:hypothetical protein [Tanacetum cinerariifolium]